MLDALGRDPEAHLDRAWELSSEVISRSDAENTAPLDRVVVFTAIHDAFMGFGDMQERVSGLDSDQLEDFAFGQGLKKALAIHQYPRERSPQ